MNVIVLVGIDLGVILLRGETVSLTPRMRDTNYRQFHAKIYRNIQINEVSSL